MEAEEYKLMFELEQEHWWYKALRGLFLSHLNDIVKKKGILVMLDAGCGTGAMLAILEKYGTAYGIDVSDIALEYCKQRALKQLIKASITKIPFDGDCFDVVLSSDVLPHKAVDNEDKAIKEFRRVLKKEGLLFLNLPAYNYLKRGHDERVQQVHRYTANEIKRKLEANGFSIKKLTYRCSFLVPLILARIFATGRKNAKSDVGKMPCILNNLLYRLMQVENILLKNIDMPFGSSIFCIAEKM